MPQKVFTPVSMGIKFVRKANMWLFYISYNEEHAPDVHEFFATKEEAQTRLEKEQNAA